MPISTGRLDLPERSDLLSAHEVEALIAEVDRDLTQLELEASAATAAADAMEQRVIDEGADERSSSWAMMQLRRFLGGLGDEVDREVAALVDVAERWSRQRVEEARLEAEAVRARGRETGCVESRTEAERVPVVAETASRWLAPEPVVVESAMPPSAACAPVADDQPLLVATSADAAPKGPAPAARVEVADAVGPTDPTEPIVAVASAAPVAGGIVDPLAPALAVPPAAGDTVDPIAADALSGGMPEPSAPDRPVPDDKFWVDAAAPTAGSRLGRIPWSAVLQVVAVLAILVFILLRLG